MSIGAPSQNPSHNIAPRRISPQDGSAAALEEASMRSLTRSEVERLQVLSPASGSPLVIIGATASEVEEAARLAADAVPGLCNASKSTIAQMVKDIHKATGLALTVLNDGGANVTLGVVGLQQVTAQGVSRQSGARKVNILALDAQTRSMIVDHAYALLDLFKEYVVGTLGHPTQGPAVGRFHIGGSQEALSLAAAEINVMSRIADWKNRGWEDAANALEHFSAGSGQGLQFDSVGLHKNQGFNKAVEELKQSWANEFEGVKNSRNSKLKTFKTLFDAALTDRAGQQTKPGDFFVNALRQDETLNMGYNLGLTFGGTSIFAVAYDGFSIDDVMLDEQGIKVSFSGKVTFFLIDPYDFNAGQPGARDAHALQRRPTCPAKPFEMQVKWEEHLKGHVIFDRALKGLRSFDTDSVIPTKGPAILEWTLHRHNVAITDDDRSVKKQ